MANSDRMPNTKGWATMTIDHDTLSCTSRHTPQMPRKLPALPTSLGYDDYDHNDTVSQEPIKPMRNSFTLNNINKSIHYEESRHLLKSSESLSPQKMNSYRNESLECDRSSIHSSYQENVMQEQNSERSYRVNGPQPLEAKSVFSHSMDKRRALQNEALYKNLRTPSQKIKGPREKENSPITPNTKPCYRGSIQKSPEASLKFLAEPILKDPWSLQNLHQWSIALASKINENGKALTVTTYISALKKLISKIIVDAGPVELEDLANTIYTRIADAGGFFLFNMSTVEGQCIQFVSEYCVIQKLNSVFPELTQNGCYACGRWPNLDNAKLGTCYSFSCQRKSRLTEIFNARFHNPKFGWEEYWSLDVRNISGFDVLTVLSKEEIRRQHILHELIQGEKEFVSDIELMQKLFQNGLLNQTDTIITSPSKRSLLNHHLFGSLPELLVSDRDYLVPSLTNRQKSQGPVIKYIGDILLHWIKIAADAYVNYARNFPFANQSLRREIAQNPQFQSFLESCQNNPACRRLDFQSFLQRPTQWLQRRVLLIDTLVKATRAVLEDENHHELNDLRLCSEQLHKTCSICDDVLAHSERTWELFDLEMRLSMNSEDHFIDWPNRTIIHRDNAERKSDIKLDWTTMHLILLDNQLLITKPKVSKNMIGAIYTLYKKPIPIDLLTFRECNFEESHSRSSVKSIGSISALSDLSLESSRRSITSADDGSKSPSKTLRDRSTMDRSPSPEKVKLHGIVVGQIGSNTEISHQFYFFSEKQRNKWVDSLIKAKANYQQQNSNSNLFKLVLFCCKSSLGDLSGMRRFVADEKVAFNDMMANATQSGIITPQSVMYQAITSSLSSPNSDWIQFRAISKFICLSDAFCMNQRYIFGASSDGVFTCEEPFVNMPWRKVLHCPNIKYLQAVEEFDALLILSEGSVMAFHLSDLLMNMRSHVTPTGVCISDSKSTLFFRVGTFNGRQLIALRNKDGFHSSILLFEPIVGRELSSVKNQSVKPFISFRQFEQFTLPVDCKDLFVFHNNIVAATTKGFEVIDLPRRKAYLIPLDESESLLSNYYNISSKLENQMPIFILSIALDEFICCYEKCAIFVDTFGSFTGKGFITWIGKPLSFCYRKNRYLMAFSLDMIEIWDVHSCQLLQIIQCSNIRQIGVYENDTTASQSSAICIASNPLKPDDDILLAVYYDPE